MNTKEDNKLLLQLQNQITKMLVDFLESQDIYCKMDVEVIQYQELESIEVKIRQATDEKIRITIHEIEKDENNQYGQD